MSLSSLFGLRLVGLRASEAAAGIGFAALLSLPIMLTVDVADAIAQQSAQSAAVGSRSRTDYDAVGGRAGGFIIYPSVEVSEIYDDNIFKELSNKDADFITSIRPKIEIRSQWSNHALNFDAGGEFRRHADESDENTEDFFANANGRVDIQRHSNLFGGVGYQMLHEARGNPNSPTAAEEPVEYDVRRANVGAFHRFNRVTVTLTGNVADYEYDDAINRTTGAVIIQRDRDRTESRAGARIGYEIQSGFEAFARGSLNFRNYDRLQGGFDRESDGYEIVAGTALDFGRLLVGEIFLGYRSQDYDDPRLATVDGPTAGGSLTWNVTELTTIKSFLSRSIEETTIPGAAGFFATTVGAGIDHELQRNILLDGRLSYSNNDYEGISREDDYLRFGLGGTYLINRYSRASLRYAYENRDSNVAGGDYDNNTLNLNLRLQF